MKKTILLITLLGIFLSTVSSQDTSKLNLKEVTHYLIEGLECKEILIQRNKQLRTKDSVISLQAKTIDSIYYKVKEIKLTTENQQKNNKYLKGAIVILLTLLIIK